MQQPENVRMLQVLGSSAGGVARHVAQIAEALAGADAEDGGPGMTVRVAGPASVRGTVAPAAGPLAFVPVEIADRPAAADVTTVRTLRRLTSEVDVVHAHGLRAGALTALAVRSLRGPQRPRLVVTLHNLPVGSWKVRAASLVLEQVVARASDVVLGVSMDLVARAERNGARRVARALVPAPPRPQDVRAASDVRSELGVGPEERLLVTVGRLAPQKGLETLCDAAERLVAGSGSSGAPSGSPVVWAVAGGGPLEGWLRGQADARGLPVRVLGFRADAPALLAAADVVVSTAVWEGQPLWIQEALAAGSAIVATDGGGTREVTGAAAKIVPVGDAAALAAAVRGLLDDPVDLTALRDAARERAAELPTLDDVVASLLPFYAPV